MTYEQLAQLTEEQLTDLEFDVNDLEMLILESELDACEHELLTTACSIRDSVSETDEMYDELIDILDLDIILSDTDWDCN